MTEREWAAARDPVTMWAFAESRMTARQRLLFAAGCCRRVWPLFTDFQLRNLVEISEAVADGQANREALEQALNELPEPGYFDENRLRPELMTFAARPLEPGEADPLPPRPNFIFGQYPPPTRVGFGIVNWNELPAWCRHVYHAARAVADFNGRRTSDETCSASGDAVAEKAAESHPNHAKIAALRERVAAEVSKLDDFRFRGMIQASERKAEEVRQLDAAIQAAISRLNEEIAAEARMVRDREATKERESQAELLRCIAGHLHRPAPDFDPAWRTETVDGLVRRMYDAREFGNMPILADALQDAGCEDGSVLTHCRHGAVHARGCWVIDQIRSWALTVAPR